ncbi:MAG: polysaccharide biosynthesis C-terminal domain-containing protein [Tepidiformaceae bacterium]
MSIAFGGIVALLFRGMNLFVSLGLLILCSNQLTKDELGTFVLGLTVVGIVNAATGGLTAATGFQVSSRRRLPGLAFSSGGIIGAGLGVVAILVGLTVGAVFAGEAHRESVAVGFACAAVIMASVLAGTLLGRESFVRYNFALVLPPLFSLILIAIAFFGFDKKSPDIALEMYALGQWLAIITLVLVSSKVILEGFGADRAVMNQILRFAAVAGVASGISYLNYRADLFLVDHFKGKEAVGTYSLAVYLGESVWQVSGSLTLATYARLGSCTRSEALALTTRVMRHTVFLIAGLCVVLFFTADIIQQLLFPKQDGMAAALRFLLPGVLLYSLAQSYSGFYTWQRGMPWVSAVVAGSGLIIDMILAVILVPRMGINGAALASAIAYSTAIIGGLVVFVRTEHLSPWQIFRFSRADVDDYRSLLGRVRGRLGYSGH